MSHENSPEGFLLLQLMRSYLELDMYASLTIHTDATLSAGRAELQRYNTLVQVSKLWESRSLSHFKCTIIPCRNIRNIFQSRNLGTSPKRTHINTSSTTFRRRVPHVVSTRRSMKKRTGHSKDFTYSILISKTPMNRYY